MQQSPTCPPPVKFAREQATSLVNLERAALADRTPTYEGALLQIANSGGRGRFTRLRKTIKGNQATEALSARISRAESPAPSASSGKGLVSPPARSKGLFWALSRHTIILPGGAVLRAAGYQQG